MISEITPFYNLAAYLSWANTRHFMVFITKPHNYLSIKTSICILRTIYTLHHACSILY